MTSMADVVERRLRLLIKGRVEDRTAGGHRRRTALAWSAPPSGGGLSTIAATAERLRIVSHPRRHEIHIAFPARTPAPGTPRQSARGPNVIEAYSAVLRGGPLARRGPAL